MRSYQSTSLLHNTFLQVLPSFCSMHSNTLTATSVQGRTLTNSRVAHSLASFDLH